MVNCLRRGGHQCRHIESGDILAHIELTQKP